MNKLVLTATNNSLTSLLPLELFESNVLQGGGLLRLLMGIVALHQQVQEQYVPSTQLLRTTAARARTTHVLTQ